MKHCARGPGRASSVSFHVASVLALGLSSAAAVASDSGALEEITVTARKESESLISVPLAVTAIGAEAIEQRGIKDIADIAAYTPSFRFQNQAVGRNDRGFKQYVIRGIVPNSALATRQVVTVFVDGAPASGGNVSGLTDIERVEIVKGPQSAFFGRSTFAGAINFVTRAPSFDWHGRVSADVASYDSRDVSASIEGPIVADKLAFRATGRYYETGGYYDNVAAPDQRLGARETKSGALSLLFTPTEQLSMRAFVTYWEDSDDALPANSRYDTRDFNCNAGAAPAGTLNYVCGELKDPPVATRRWDPYVYPIGLEYLQGKRGTGYTLHGADFITHPGLEREAYQARLSADYDLPGGYTVSALAATSLNKWGFLQTIPNYDNRAIPNPFFGRVADVLPYNYSLVLGNTQDKDRTFELRFSSPRDDAFRWSLGANYAYARTDNLTTIFGNTGYLLATPRTINQSDTYGVFGAASYSFDNGVTLTAEARYQKDELLQQTRQGTNPLFEDTFKSFTPRFIAEWEFAPERMVYASFSEGNRPGAFNTIFFAQTPAVQEQIRQQANVEGSVPEDKLEMIELGVKGQFLDGRLRLLADVYFGDWTNRHIPNFVTFRDANNQNQSIQVTAPNGEVDLRGVEVEAAWRPIPELTLEATFSIAETEIKRTFCTDCQVTTGNATPVGTQLPYYPEKSGTFAVTYERPAFGDWLGSARADLLYTDRIYDSEANLAWTAPSSRVNLRFALSNDRYRVELYGTNVFGDETGTSLARTAQTVFSPTGATAGQSQGITVSLADKPVYGVRATVEF
jgi:iron complex outermembrane receptor protein